MSFDPLSISWTHAYWTEGPEFLATDLAKLPAQWHPGVIEIGATSYPVSLWPDEVGTADLVQATDANKPLYTPTGTTMNNRPMVWTGDVSDKRFLAVDWTDIAQPYEVVMVGRARAPLSAGRPLWDSIGSGFANLSSTAVGGSVAGTGWRMSIDNGGGVSQGGTRDSNSHLFRMIANAGSSGVWIDEANVISGGAGAGTNAMSGLTIGSSALGISGTAGYNDYCFIAVKSGALTATERSNLHTWAQGLYATP